MLETLDLNLSLDKETYKPELMRLMRNLRSLQQACWQKKLPAIVVLEGWAAAGKGALLQKMVGYMDPRGFEVHPIWPPTADESLYPFLWRFWQKLPERGKFSIFYHSWYTHVLEDRLFGRIPESQIPTAFQEINAFERQLVDDGAAIAKFWIHLSKKELKKRLKKHAKDPLNAWRVRSKDWQQSKHYQEYAAFAEEMLQQTSTGIAPWTLVEGDDKRWTRIKVLTQMAASLTEALDRCHGQQPVPQATPQTQLAPTEPDLLSSVDLSVSLSHDDYKAKLREQQIRLRKLQQKIYQNQVPVLILFEGWDAAGKGGAIKRLTDVLDPRSYKVRAFGVPTEEEKQHHYLWRFWRHVPPAGQLAIFDRSWYGRVLVERVEGFATEAQWRRAYREINEFESQLVSAGYVLVKLWLHISPDEQLKRFYERKENPWKSHKLTEEDWRNREKWSLYEVAVNQSLQRTSTPTAPWTIVPGNDKYYARVRTIEAVSTAMEKQLQQS